MVLLRQCKVAIKSVAGVGTWEKNNLDNMKVMLVAKGRRLDSVGRAVADPSVF